MSRLAFIALCFFVAYASGQILLNDTKISATYHDQSAAVYPWIELKNTPTEKNYSFSITFLSLTEVNDSGHVFAQVSFQQTQAVWTQPANKPTEVDLSTIVALVNGVNTSITIDTAIFNESTTAKQGSTKIPVQAHSLKWTLTVSNWTFSNPNNNLQLAAVLGSTVSKQQLNETKSQGSDIVSAFVGNNSKNAVLWQTFPTTALVTSPSNKTSYPDVVVDATTNTTLPNFVTNNTVVAFTVTFNAFNGTLVYDPDLSFPSSDKATVSSNHVFIIVVVAVVCGAIIVIVVAVIVVLFLRRKRASYEEV